MKKVFDNIFFTSMDLKFVHYSNLAHYRKNKKWQCINVTSSFEDNFETLLKKDKKILLLGDWRRNTKWFRFLKSRNYKVYLQKKVK